MKSWFSGHNKYYRFVKGETNWPVREFPEFRIKPIYRWFDLYAGAYVDTKNKLIYFFPVPMFGFCIGYQYSSKPGYGEKHE